MANVQALIEMKPWLILVRFEQGRGKSGVPKTWMPYWAGHPKNSNAKPEIATLVRTAISIFRAQCVDPSIGHGRDMMPGNDDEYQLHHIDGGLIEKTDDIRWRTINGEQRSEAVLTWRDPAELLVKMIEGKV
jgi:hypothetical protein